MLSCYRPGNVEQGDRDASWPMVPVAYFGNVNLDIWHVLCVLSHRRMIKVKYQKWEAKMRAVSVSVFRRRRMLPVALHLMSRLFLCQNFFFENRPFPYNSINSQLLDQTTAEDTMRADRIRDQLRGRLLHFRSTLTRLCAGCSYSGRNPPHQLVRWRLDLRAPALTGFRFLCCALFSHPTWGL